MIKDVNNFNIQTTEEEKQNRLQLCNSCPQKTIIDANEICDKCACPIDYVISQKYKLCPLEKW